MCLFGVYTTLLNPADIGMIEFIRSPLRWIIMSFPTEMQQFGGQTYPNIPNITGWWFPYPYPSEKYEFVNWDDYPQCMEK